MCGVERNREAGPGRSGVVSYSYSANLRFKSSVTGGQLTKLSPEQGGEALKCKFAEPALIKITLLSDSDIHSKNVLFVIIPEQAATIKSSSPSRKHECGKGAGELWRPAPALPGTVAGT